MSSNDPVTSIKQIAEDDEKAHLLRYANLFLLSEIKEKMDMIGMKKFTTSKITKLTETLKPDFELHIEEKKDRTLAKSTLLVQTICELVTALKAIKGGRSGDGQEGSLTKLDKQIKTVFSDFFKGSSEDKVAGQEESRGELLAGSSSQPPHPTVKISNIFTKFDIGAIKRVPKVEKPKEAEQKSGKVAVDKPGKQRERKASVSVRPDHVSRQEKMTASLLKRRNCHSRGLRKQSEDIIQEAIDKNREIGDVASDARNIMRQDKWDVFGRSIAQKMTLLFEDEAQQILVASQLLNTVYQDGFSTSH